MFSSEAGCNTVSMVASSTSCLSRVSICVSVHCLLRATEDGVLMGVLPVEWGIGVVHSALGWHWWDYVCNMLHGVDDDAW